MIDRLVSLRTILSLPTILSLTLPNIISHIVSFSAREVICPFPQDPQEHVRHLLRPGRSPLGHQPGELVDRPQRAAKDRGVQAGRRAPAGGRSLN